MHSPSPHFLPRPCYLLPSSLYSCPDIFGAVTVTGSSKNLELKSSRSLPKSTKLFIAGDRSFIHIELLQGLIYPPPCGNAGSLLLVRYLRNELLCASLDFYISVPGRGFVLGRQAAAAHWNLLDFSYSASSFTYIKLRDFRPAVPVN
ncbi:hypothetical protein KSP39_PZI015056 [Platanthera zijinensis]|uniref:Uncharacterized protein n=1 Tax=Platanthera zijinensis TaxID=2320716 RepID=A0AAP0BB23_9ASPA